MSGSHKIEGARREWAARVARRADWRERHTSLRCGRDEAIPLRLPGAGGRGMTRRFRPERRERGERWAFGRRQWYIMAAEQDELRVACLRFACCR